MKINEITEGFGSSLAASLAKQIGANSTADAILKGAGSGGSLPTTQRLIDAIVGYAKKNGGNFSLAQIGQLLNNKFPNYWKSVKNKAGVVQTIATELDKVGVNTGVPAQDPNAVKPGFQQDALDKIRAKAASK